MCGIVGMMAYGGGIESARRWVRGATDLMVRRGPDASGSWSDGDHCAFGFRRLAILDLTDAGNQPMLTPDGRYALVFNGELYNFKEIREVLCSRGVSFRSTGDAEVVLQALAVFGVRALESFNGMFALAFYDTVAKRLVLARDHAAIKPLYVLRHREGLVFASQYDQILAHPWARSYPLDAGGLALYLNLGYIPAPYAALANTSLLEAGTWLSVDRDARFDSGRYFSFPQEWPADLAGDAAFEALDAAVDSAVRRQMVSDVPVGVLLSGGIDSPLVAAKARRAAGRPVPAFTIATGGDRFDESDDARRYAERLGLDHTVRQIAPADVPRMIDDVVTAYSEPHDDYSIFPTTLVCRVARERVTVALAGDGGDDLFWGYPWRNIAPLADGAAESGSLGATQFNHHRFVAPRQLERVFSEIPPLPTGFRLFECGPLGIDRAAQWLRWNEYSGHLARVLQKVDRASMHESLEVRVPLLDREVVGIALRTDWRSAVDLVQRRGKLPLRAALQREAGFQTIAKRGFSVPMSRWLRGPLKEMIFDLLLSRREIAGVPLNVRALEQIYRFHRLRIRSAPWLLWRLLSLALWETRHYRATPIHA
jgi:asparagine synthase (glutamine-hydrolysing)